MNFDPRIHHRRSIRLPGYDYSQPGAYFITIVTQNRATLLGDIFDGAMQLSQMGQIAGECWRAIPNRLPNVELGAFVVMPNHVHGILILHDHPGRGVVSTPPGDATSPLRRPTLGQVVAYYKYQSAKQINTMLCSPGAPVWQRNYYEHIIRKDEEHQRIQLYIESNVDNWGMDDENPVRST